MSNKRRKKSAKFSITVCNQHGREKLTENFFKLSTATIHDMVRLEVSDGIFTGAAEQKL